jgi:hypothetical protein
MIEYLLCLFDENILFSSVREFKHFNKENLFDVKSHKKNHGNINIKCYNTPTTPAAILI